MQAKAAEDLRRMVTDKLVAEGLVYEGAKAFCDAAAVDADGAWHSGAAVRSEGRAQGPRVGGPDAAIQGFLKATGLASLDEAKIQRDPKKGDFYVALIEKPGRATLDVLADMLPVIIRTFLGRNRCAGANARRGRARCNGCGRCIAIVATFGMETRNRRCEIRRRRHRGRPDHLWPSLHGAGADFRAPLRGLSGKLQAAKVVLDPQGRKDIISATPASLRSRKGLNWSRIRCCSMKSRAWSNGLSC